MSNGTQSPENDAPHYGWEAATIDLGAVRLAVGCGCGHGADVHDQYGCVTCWDEMGDPCDIPPTPTPEATR